MDFMRVYESIVILDPQFSETQIAEALKSYEGILTKNAAKVMQKNELGKKPIIFKTKRNEGFFVQVDFQADPKNMKEINHAVRLADFILHAIIFVKEEAVSKK
jgi:small subunit ribosomal protein S6